MSQRNKSRVNFVNQMVQQYSKVHQLGQVNSDPKTPAQFVEAFTKHYKSLYDRDIARGVERRLSHLSSVQSSLSRFKKKLRTTGVDEAWLKKLHLPKKEANDLMLEKKTNVSKNSIDLPLLQADDIIHDCKQFLTHPNKYVKIIAVAALTGRREAEIIHSMRFGSPKEHHYTSEKYWSCVTGILKQRSTGGVVSREVPLLAERKDIVAAVTAIRESCPAKNVQEVNKKYAKNIARTMQKFCPELGKLHELRKFYVAVCFHYFNERNCSLPRIAADYLGHKTMSETVLTYLSARLTGLGSINFGHGQLNKKKTSSIKKRASARKKSVSSTGKKTCPNKELSS